MSKETYQCQKRQGAGLLMCHVRVFASWQGLRFRVRVQGLVLAHLPLHVRFLDVT